MAITNKAQFIFGGAVPGPGNWQSTDADGMRAESDNSLLATGQTLDSGDKTQTAKAFGVVAARGNYYVGAGAVNVYTAVPADTQKAIFEYQAGMEIQVLITAATNTGASTINVDGLGAVNIFYNGVAVIAGMIPINTIIRLRYDGTRFNLIQDIDNDAFTIDKINKRISIGKANPTEAIDAVGNATVTGQSEALNTAKAYLVYNLDTQTILKSKNILSAVRLGLGELEITFSVGLFTDANYIMSGLCEDEDDPGANMWVAMESGAKTPGSVIVFTVEENSGAKDSPNVSIDFIEG